MWAAGFFEGEGAVGQRHLHVSQASLWPLERLKKFFGGNIGPGKGVYQWHICGSQGRDFVEEIYPHLSPRRQAQIDIKFLTWNKFKLDRLARLPKQREHLARFEHSRDAKTGRFRCLSTPNQVNSQPSEMLKAS